MSEPKLTPKLQARLATMIRAGISIASACESCGICRRSFYNWTARGEREQSGKYFAFTTAIRKAESEVEKSVLETILEASKKDWRAGSWYLERRFPRRWGSHAAPDEQEPEEDPEPESVETKVYEIGGRKFLSLDEALKFQREGFRLKAENRINGDS